jgi:hypothetical protein
MWTHLTHTPTLEPCLSRTAVHPPTCVYFRITGPAPSNTGQEANSRYIAARPPTSRTPGSWHDWRRCSSQRTVVCIHSHSIVHTREAPAWASTSMKHGYPAPAPHPRPPRRRRRPQDVHSRMSPGAPPPGSRLTPPGACIAAASRPAPPPRPRCATPPRAARRAGGTRTARGRSRSRLSAC